MEWSVCYDHYFFIFPKLQIYFFEASDSDIKVFNRRTSARYSERSAEELFFMSAFTPIFRRDVMAGCGP